MKNQFKNQNFEVLNKDIKIKNYTQIPHNANQILLGSLLGDMHCNREGINVKIEESHSIDQKEYLLWKINGLNMFRITIKESPITLTKFKDKEFVRKPQIKFWSRVSPLLNIYYEMLYKNDKKSINEEILNQIDTLGLAVWYCDDGSYDYHDKHVTLHTEGFTNKENKILQQWFKNKWNLISTLRAIPSGKVGIKFNVENSDKFLKLIKNHIIKMPDSIRYKLGHLWIGNLNKINKCNLMKELRTKEYRSKEEIRERDRIRGLKYYRKNKAKINEYSRKYCKSDKYKRYLKIHRNKQDVKDKIKKYQKEYRKQLKYRNWHLNYQREYRKRPEVKNKLREYNKRAKERIRRDKN